MFCSKCGFEMPNDAMFCAKCGAKITVRPEKEMPAKPDAEETLASEAARPKTTSEPKEAAENVTEKTGSDAETEKGPRKKIAIIAVVVIVAIAAFILVRFFACSTPPEPPHLNEIAKSDVQTAKQMLSKYKTDQKLNDALSEKDAPLVDYAYFSNAEVLKQAKEGNGFWLGGMPEGDWYINIACNSPSSKVNNCRFEICPQEKPQSAKDVADIVGKVATFDQGYFYLDDGSYMGFAKGDGCFMVIRGSTYGYGDVGITICSLDSGAYGALSFNYGVDFDNDYRTFNTSKYADAYKK